MTVSEVSCPIEEYELSVAIVNQPIHASATHPTFTIYSLDNSNLQSTCGLVIKKGDRKRFNLLFHTPI